MLDLTYPMRDAMALLMVADAELGGDHWRPTFRVPSGQVIDGQTVKALTKRALGRLVCPERRKFTLTAAGRREFKALQTRTAR